MKYCTHCNLSVAGERKNCPLCQHQLRGEGSTPEAFPHVKTIYHQFSRFFRFFLFASIAAAVVLIAVNLVLEETGMWSLFGVAGIVCMWLSLSLAIKKRKNIPKGMLYQVVLISCISVLWDVWTGWHNWSVDYVIPILCVAVLASMLILSRIFNWQTENIIIYLWISALFCILPLVFYATGILRVKIPSVICFASSFISIAGIVVFQWDSIWAELKRRLSI